MIGKERDSLKKKGTKDCVSGSGAGRRSWKSGSLITEIQRANREENPAFSTAVSGGASVQPGSRCCAAAAGGCHGDEPHRCNALSCDFFFFFFSCTQRLAPAGAASLTAAAMGRRSKGAWSSARGNKWAWPRAEGSAARGEAGFIDSEIARTLHSIWQHIRFNVVIQTMQTPSKSLHYAVEYYALYYYFPLYLFSYHHTSKPISQEKGAET